VSRRPARPQASCSPNSLELPLTTGGTLWPPQALPLTGARNAQLVTDPKPAFEIHNVRLFVLFRLLFSARFYYPVFTILFLDYGLSLEQFAILNVIWSLTIVLAEVPSGALADLVGRRTLVVTAATLMLVELATIALVPTGNSTLVFSAFVVNRICSGLAEASASGADEALAYDSLAAEGDAAEWPRVLERLGRLSSLAFFVAMISGALVYDPQVMNTLAHALGFDVTLGRAELLRVPVIMTLVTGFGAWLTALRLREVGEPRQGLGLAAIRTSFKQMWAAVRWTLGARFVLFVILAGLVLDSVARQFVLLASEYFRQIQIPTALFGPIMAGMALVGIVTAKAGRLMAERLSPLTNLLLLSALQLVGLIGVAFALPGWGLIFVPALFSMLSLVGFLQSHYLNAHVDSDKRATVLSLRGLALNLGLGVASLLYTVLVASLKRSSPHSDPVQVESAAFVDALTWFVPYFAALLVLVLVAGRLSIPERGRCTKPC
jgi:MFS family permease